MSIDNLQQNRHYRQEAIYNVFMSNYDADAFAEWLTESFEKSSFKSFAALAADAKLSRSSVSSLANAKKQLLTDKPSQPKVETVVGLAKSLNQNVNQALLLAGHAPITDDDVRVEQIVEGVRIQMDGGGKLSKRGQDKILEAIRYIAKGIVQEENENAKQ